jgi:predicted PurR-regulated permease PerM
VNLNADLAPAAKGAMKFVANYAASAVKNVLLFLLQLFLVVFSLFFLYRDGRRIQRGFWSVLPVEEEKKRALEGIVSRILPSVLMGVLLTALVQGILGGIGFWISGLPSPFFFGALICVASLLPVVGTMLVWLPGALYLLFQGMTGFGIFLLAWGILVVGFSDNILRPLLSRKQSGLPVSLLMLGSLGGLVAFGLVGVILGPVVIGISLALLEMYKTPPPASPRASAPENE